MPSKKRDQDPRHFTHGAGGAMADAATEASPHKEDHLPTSPHARRTTPLAPNQKPDQLAGKVRPSEGRKEARIDEAVEESFPASDPPSAHQIT